MEFTDEEISGQRLWMSARDREILHCLERINNRLDQLTLEVKIMAGNDQQLTAAVTQLFTVITAYQAEVATVIAGLPGSAAADDPAVTDAITKLTALSGKLEAAITALTPTPTPTPAPAPAGS